MILECRYFKKIELEEVARSTTSCGVLLVNSNKQVTIQQWRKEIFKKFTKSTETNLKKYFTGGI